MLPEKIKKPNDRMKKRYMILLATAGLAACSPKTPKEIKGKIVDATMNTVTILSDTDSLRLTFSTENADLQHAHGLLTGNTATVAFRGKLRPVTPALRIETDPTYIKAIGRWVEPNPIAPEKEQGIEIGIGGTAASINMQTLRYRSWEVTAPNRIILYGESEGNGQSFSFEQPAQIIEQDGKPFLKIDAVLLQKRDFVR